MTDVEPEIKIQTQPGPKLIFEDYHGGSGRADFKGGNYLAIPSGVQWVARYDKGGKTVWQHPLPFDNAGDAEMECDRHARSN